jgi:hypothetical protein
MCLYGSKKICLFGRKKEQKNSEVLPYFCLSKHFHSIFIINFISKILFIRKKVEVWEQY